MLSRLILPLLLLLGQQPSREGTIQAKVTFAKGPARLELLLPELGKEIKIPLLFDATTKDEIVVIRVEGVLVSELMKKIAEVCSAEWTPEGEGFRLTRPAAIDQREASVERLALEKEIREKLKALSKYANAPGLATTAAARALAAELNKAEEEPPEDESAYKKWMDKQNATWAQLPMPRAFARVAGLLDARNIASLPEGNWVYSNRPNRMQFALPDRAGLILQDLIREQNLLAPFIPKIDHEDPEHIDSEGMFSSAEIKPLPTDARLLLSIGRGTGAVFRIQLDIVNANGEVIISEGGGMGADGPMFSEEDPPKKEESAAQAEEPLVMPPDAMEFSKAYSEEGKVSDSLRQKLLRPEEFDPASLGQSSLLAPYAERKKLNLVARVPENEWYDEYEYEEGPAQPKTPSQFKASVIAGQSAVWLEEAGWLTVKPAKPYANRKAQESRRILGEAVRALDARKVLSFEERLRYVNSTPESEEYGSWFETYVYMLEPAWASVNWMPDRDSARLFGALSVVQKQALANGFEQPVSSLPPQQRAVADFLIFRTDAVRQGGAKPEDRPAPIEPTEAMPDGMPSDAVMRGSIERSTVYLTRSSKGAFPYGAPASAKRLGSLLWRRERDPGDKLSAIDRLLPVVQCIATLKFNLQPGLSASFSVQWYERVPNEREFTFEQLPAEFREEAEKEQARLREAAKNRPRVEPKPPPPAKPLQ